MQSILISEFICSGALTGISLPESLAREGLGMLRAVCADAVNSSKFKVYTTIDHRLKLNISEVHCTEVFSEDDEWLQFQKLAKLCDLTLVIAPEFNKILLDRVQWLVDNNCRHCLSDPHFIERTSNKLEFANWAVPEDIPTPRTLRIDLHEISLKHEHAMGFHYPLIIKPQWGAGAMATALLLSDEDFSQFRNENLQSEYGPFLIQPYYEGIPLSLSCIRNPANQSITWTPLGRQEFNGLRYLGGTISFACEVEKSAFDISEKVVRQHPGLNGWIGFDFLFCHDRDEPMVLLEVNPRLTTSYLGYRQLTQSNLAAIMLGCESDSPIEWSNQPIQFRLES
ncbi:ATP-grasp domain-containing protein [Rubinisphaera italica]|uniref:Carbamoyl phosphate synthase-like protein n=1 Tax=Rubinisphaera italica TaxID=2527969 RepID=A0A5C5XBD8_9PLAN|nr:ATP-grasp domain-containing protein [Rubinisphaera italica]TWT60098.1 carbamoyl phosphate synthase-like protein [Rubinisphaera italica]